MKKIFLLFAAVFLLFINCKEEDAPQPLSIVGTWKAVKMVKTTVLNNGQPDSDTFVYTDCEAKTRYVFNEDLAGKVTVHGFLNQQCLLLSDQNMTYVYDSKTRAITIKYVTLKDVGSVEDLTENTMNLKIEIIEPNVYESRTYTLVKIN